MLQTATNKEQMEMQIALGGTQNRHLATQNTIVSGDSQLHIRNVKVPVEFQKYTTFSDKQMY